MARNTKDLLEIIEELNNKKVYLISNKESLDTSTPQGKLMVTMLGAIAEFERSLILERQKEGIAIAKAEGKFKGKQIVNMSNDDFEKALELYKSREINKSQMAEMLKISRTTLYKLLAERNVK